MLDSLPYLVEMDGTPTSRDGRRSRPKDPGHPIARFCRAAREHAAMTKSQFADRLDVTKSVVSQWESGQTHPKAEILVRVSLLANYSLDALTLFAVDPKLADQISGIRGRVALLPPLLRDEVLHALTRAENLSHHMTPTKRTNLLATIPDSHDNGTHNTALPEEVLQVVALPEGRNNITIAARALIEAETNPERAAEDLRALADGLAESRTAFPTGGKTSRRKSSVANKTAKQRVPSTR